MVTAVLKDVKGNPISNAPISYSLNGGEKVNTTTDANGNVVIKVDEAGELLILYGGNDFAKPSNASFTFDVVNTTSISVIEISGNGYNITAVLKDRKGNPISNANISYSIDGGEKINLITNDKGEIIAKAKDNSQVLISFGGNGFAKASNASFTLVNVCPALKATKIIVDKVFTRVAVDYSIGERGSYYYFYLKDIDGNPLANKVLKMGCVGKIYTIKTDNNGRAGFPISLSNAGSYTYALSFLGDDEYAASFEVSELKVVKKALSIIPAKTSYNFKAYAKSKVITATLKTTNKYLKTGKKVTLTIAGKKFTTTVGKNGAIKFNIGMITKKGTYNAYIQYAGDNTYSSATSRAITVKIA